MKSSILKEKSFAFAIRIVRLYQFLVESKKEFVLSKQVLRSGTAIGALVREAEYGQSKRDFVSKLSISLKEANETIYWLEILKTTDYIGEKEFSSMKRDGEELLKMLTASVKTAKKNSE